jgi:hypothetical protein
VVGANINFTEDGQFHSILDAALIRHLTDTLSAERNPGRDQLHRRRGRWFHGPGTWMRRSLK